MTIIKLLRLGSRGDNVIALQQALNNRAALIDYPELIVDGFYGDKTFQFVQKWQQLLGLTVDGIAGKNTLNALGIKLKQPKSIAFKTLSVSKKFKASKNIEAVIHALLPLWSGDPVKAQLHVQRGIEAIGSHLKTVHLQTQAEIAIFAAMMREETSSSFITAENLNYRCSALIKIFSIYRERHALAQQHGRCNNHPANQILIANHAYANRLGNGNADSQDGSCFAGGGIFQTTGKSNYKAYHDWLLVKFPDVYKQTHGAMILKKGQAILKQAPHSFLSAVYFWDKNQLWRQAQHGFNRAACDYATRAINPHTRSYEKRWHHAKQAITLLNCIA